MRSTAADIACAALEELGTKHVFGLPGTQTLPLWEALRRRDGLRSVVTTSELMAAFAAIGYARASGRTGVLMTIGGPGLTYALTGLAEARLDSVPLVHIVAGAAERQDGGYALQSVRQRDLLEPLVKSVIDVVRPDDMAQAIRDAMRVAGAGEPGPVVVQIAPEVMGAPARRANRAAPGDVAASPDVDQFVEHLVARLSEARRPILYCGQGAAMAADAIVRLAETLSAPVLTTTSGRGVIPETHPLSLVLDVPGAPREPLNELLATSDLVLVLGCKFSHNGSHGFSLRLNEEQLVRVDASPDVMGRAYAAGTEIVGDVSAVVGALERGVERAAATTWTMDEISSWQRRLAKTPSSLAAARLGGVPGPEFFAALEEGLPSGAVMTTDSGRHQYVARAHVRVGAPLTFLIPADFQAMGFGIPAAIGAAIATGRRAVAVVGDGGFNIAGTELLTAVREGANVTAVVFVDRQFGLIRTQQLHSTGHTFGVEIPVAHLELFAASVGAAYLRFDESRLGELSTALEQNGVQLVEVPVDYGPDGWARARGLAVSTARSALSQSVIAALRRSRPG